MKKIIEFIKSKKIILLTVISVTSIIFIFAKINDSKKPTDTEPKDISDSEIQEVSLENIIPGKTSIEKINELLGYPTEATKSGNLDLFNYRSSNKYRTHKVYSKDGLAELVIEEIINKEKTANTIQKIYGLAPEILYEKTAMSTFNLYIYPNDGIAYLGHKDGTLTEVWYFVPTTIEDFISKWGSDYSKEPSKEIPKY